MADLEEAGLLKQPHTSSGRVPTNDVRGLVLDELGKEKNRVDALASRALAFGQAALSAAETPPPDVIVSGSANLLEPNPSGEPANLDKMRALLVALEEKERIVR